jgi:LPXTG-site transpeptidase (sortase) family protein
MIAQKRMASAGSALICLGACLLVCVAGVYVYGLFEAWIQTQPRELVSDQLIWPEVPPLTPLPSSTPVPTPTPGPPLRIEIPKLNIDRAIVPVGTVTTGGRTEWDAEKLFASSGRHDLVGHLEGTANPGQAGNIVLIGHNYNRGFFNWTGVFHSLRRLRKGDEIKILNEKNEPFVYQVAEVEKVPVRKFSSEGMLSHIAYLSPTQDETLTLVTCCQFSPASVPPFFGNSVPVFFGKDVPPVFGQSVPPVKVT